MGVCVYRTYMECQKDHNSGQVIWAHVPLSLSSIIWYRCKSWGSNDRIRKRVRSTVHNAGHKPTAGSRPVKQRREPYPGIGWCVCVCVCSYTDERVRVSNQHFTTCSSCIMLFTFTFQMALVPHSFPGHILPVLSVYDRYI